MKGISGSNFSIKKTGRLLMSLALALLLITQAALPAAAKTSETFKPAGGDNEFYPVVYNNTNGLPTAEANDIAQTSEGFIWIGCYAGLVRYDGDTFERMDSTEGLSSISILHVDRHDRLWIGTNDSGVGLLWDGELRFWDVDEGLGSSKVTDITEDDSGTIYVGTTSGIVMFKSGTEIQKLEDYELVPLTDSRIANIYIDRMASGVDGLIYCTTPESQVFLLRDGNLVNFYEKDQTGIEDITTIYPDPKKPGKVYYGTEDNGIFYVDIKAGPESAEHISIEPFYSVNKIMEVNGRLWVCTRSGVGYVDDSGFHDMSYLPVNNSIDEMMVDYEGNLWFTSSRQGVMKLVKNRFTDIYMNYGLEEAVVNTTCLLDGKMYIGTDTGLTVIDESGVVDSVPVTSARTASGVPVAASDLVRLLDEARVRSVIRDSKNRLWISTWKNLGLLRFDHGELTVFGEDEGLLSDRIRTVYETKDGKMLVALTGGLNIIEDDSVIASYTDTEGIANVETLNVCEAPNGDILVGSNGDGIYVVNEKGVRTIGKKDGLTSGVVMRIKHDEGNKVFWLITGNSLAYMTEDYEVTTVHNFPYPDNLDIYKNRKGDMWILSSDGIYVSPAAELLKNEKIDPVHYGIANGIPSTATSNSYSELTGNGDLYIASRTGVAKVNIEDSLEEVNNLKMSVPYIEVNDKPVYDNGDGSFTVPAKARKIAVCCYVYNYSLTDPTVSFMLKGFDEEMMTVKQSELDKIYYTNLPGGNYTFVMELNDAMGRGSKILTTKITKEKALYEQFGFIAGMLIIGALIALYIVNTFVGRKLRKVEEKHREDQQKALVANELHMASQIQSAVLPHTFPPFPERGEIDIYASMDPAREVGGDFYDFFFIDDDHLGLVIADVSGKGIPASLFMMNTKVLLKTYAQTGISPSEVLERANREICENNQLDMFVTVWLGILELSSGRLTAANAGHEYPVIGHPVSGFELIKDKHGFVIGGMDGMKYKDYELKLEPGDKLFVYTDGVPEATDSNKQLFGTDRMLEALNTDKDASPEEMLANVYMAVGNFVGEAEKFDDLTMLGLEYHGPAKE